MIHQKNARALLVSWLALLLSFASIVCVIGDVVAAEEEKAFVIEDNLVTATICILDPEKLPTWEAKNGSRGIMMLVTRDSCASEAMMTGLFLLHPGQKSLPDIHPTADEIYFVVSGEGILELGNEREKHALRTGMTVFIPANVHHQSINHGKEDLVLYFIFAPPPSAAWKMDTESWVKTGG